MAAHDHLSPQFDEFEVHPSEIGYMTSDDFAVRLGDMEFAPGGENDQRVNKIMDSAKTEGIREPLDVYGAHLRNGNHRYVAAKRLNIPVRVRQYRRA